VLSTLHAADGLRPAARRLTRWLLAAMLLAMLAPGVSRGLAVVVRGPVAGSGAAHWVELCTSQGMQWVRADGQADDSSGDSSTPNALDHCGLCTLAAERFAPLIAHWLIWQGIRGPQPTPTFAVWASVQVPARAALARGPPILS
jgi:hypothetical protein